MLHKVRQISYLPQEGYLIFSSFLSLQYWVAECCCLLYIMRMLFRSIHFSHLMQLLVDMLVCSIALLYRASVTAKLWKTVLLHKKTVLTWYNAKSFCPLRLFGIWKLKIHFLKLKCDEAGFKLKGLGSGVQNGTVATNWVISQANQTVTDFP